MNTWKDVVITEKGLALQTKLMEGSVLKFTKAEAGTDVIEVENLPFQTTVAGYKQSISFQRGKVNENGIEIQILLNNVGLESSYSLHQIGIYAQDPEEGEILYCIAQTSEGKTIPSDEENPGFSITWKFLFQNFGSSSTELEINSAGLVSMELFQELSERVEQLNVDLLEKVYPIGSIYISSVDTNPNSIFGGIWEKFAKGRTLIGVDENDTVFQKAGTLGGHKELQSHNHSFTGSSVTTSTTGNHTHTFTGTAVNTGKSGNHSHTVRNVHYFDKAVAKGTNYARWNSDGKSVTNDWGDVTTAGEHYHSITAQGNNSTTGNHAHTVTTAGSIGTAGTGNAGNMPPYITVYFWKRVA